MPDYIIRGIDPKLWEAFRRRAAKEGHTFRWVLLQLITRYVERGLD